MKNKNGFTLVELIVVIAILAILWTIWFISLQWYWSEARDSKRIADIWQTRTWLEVYRASNWILPEPDDKIEIYNSQYWVWTNSWVLIWYQWNIWDNLSSEIWMVINPLDPDGETKYTYYLSENKTRYQIVSFMDLEKYSYFSNSAFADSDLSQRVPRWFGSRLWTLLDSNNVPIQDLLPEQGQFDVMSDSLWELSIVTDWMQPIYKSWTLIFSDSVANTWYEWSNYTNWEITLNLNYSEWNKVYPSVSCDRNDIVIYWPNWDVVTMSSCDLWSSKSNIWWVVYQFWNNHPFSIYDNSIKTSTWLTNTYDLWDRKPSSYFNDTVYSEPISVETQYDILNIWWAKGNYKSWWRGACPSWYHIMTSDEAVWIFETLYWVNCWSHKNWSCVVWNRDFSDYWYSSEVELENRLLQVIDELKIPKYTYLQVNWSNELVMNRPADPRPHYWTTYPWNIQWWWRALGFNNELNANIAARRPWEDRWENRLFPLRCIKN